MKFLEGVPTAEHCSDISHPPALPSFWLRFGVSCWTRASALKKLCGLFIPAIFYLPPRVASDPRCAHLLLAWLTCALGSNPSEAEGCVSSSVPSQAGKNHLPDITFQLLHSGDHHKPAQPGWVLSNRLTHNHPSKRAFALEVKSPVFNTSLALGLFFSFLVTLVAG